MLFSIMIETHNYKKYVALIGLILIVCSILIALIYAFTFDPNNINEMTNDISYYLGNGFFYIGILLLIISGLLYFKDKFL